MFTNEEMTVDQITRIADALSTPAEDSGTVTVQLARIADALERIAAAMEPMTYAARGENPPNIHGLLASISVKP